MPGRNDKRRERRRREHQQHLKALNERRKAERQDLIRRQEQMKSRSEMKDFPAYYAQVVAEDCFKELRKRGSETDAFNALSYLYAAGQ